MRTFFLAHGLRFLPYSVFWWSCCPLAMLIQTDRFGTPLSKSLGNFSDALRTQRRQQAEEAAAKTTIKLVPPLVFFIFPNIAITTVMPAVVTVFKNIGHIVE